MIATAFLVLVLAQPGPTPAPTPSTAPAPSPAPTPSPAPVAPVADPKAAAPAWVWTEGREEHYRSVVKQSATSEGLLGFRMSDEQQIDFSTRVVSVASGTATVELRLDGVRAVLKPSPTIPAVTVDSAAPPGSEEFDPDAPARSLVGSTLTLTIAPDGAVGEVRGLPEFRARVKKAFAEPAALAGMVDPVLAAITDRSVASAVGGVFSLADTPAASVLLRGVGMLNAAPTTTREQKDGRLTTTRKVVYSMATPNTDPAARSFEISAKDSSVESTSVADPREGRLVSYRSTMTLTLTFTPRAGAKDLSAMTRTMTQTVEVSPRPATPQGPAGPERP